jgi:hypothetical protein
MAEALASEARGSRFESGARHQFIMAEVAQRQRQQVENLSSVGSNPALGTIRARSPTGRGGLKTRTGVGSTPTGPTMER